MEQQNSGNVLVRANLNHEEIKNLLFNLYGFQCTNIKELNGYDDKNYLVMVDSENFENENVGEICKNGYVFKIINTLDSKDLEFMDALNKIALFLEPFREEVRVSKPIQNKNGQYFSVERLKTGKHVVRLLEFIPGRVLLGIEHSPRIYYQIGQTGAKIDKILQKFYHSAYDHRKSEWMLESVPEIRKYVHVIQNERRRNLLNVIITEFEEFLKSDLPLLERGLIHGDLNESNILVDFSSSEDISKNSLKNWNICAILDFGDSSFSYYLFEVAIAMTYVIILTKNLEDGGYVLAGYNSIQTITDREKKFLKLCILARICQSLILGAYYGQQDPDNDYIVTTQKNGWEILEKLWEEPNESLLEKWDLVAGKLE